MIYLKSKISQMIGLKSLKMTRFNSKSLFSTLCLLVGFLIVLLLPNTSKAAEVTFNKVFKGTGNSYGANTQNVPVTNLLAGTSFKFISRDPSLAQYPNGNDTEGNFQYVDGSGNTQTIFGMISRQFKVSGNVVHGFYFVPLNPGTGIETGDAYVFIMTDYDAIYNGNETLTTSSDFSEASLNAYLLSQQSRTVNLSATTGSVSETGTTTSFNITLGSQPASNVVLNITRNDVTEAISNKTTLTFTSANWNTAQTVTVTGVDDNLIDGTQSTIFTIAVDAANSDNNYDNAASKTYTVSTTDNDVAGFTLSSTSGSVSESGATKTFTVVLTAQPASNVVLSLVSGTLTEATVSPATLTFTSANWNTPQTVTVTGVDDALVDGTQNSIITVAVVDADSDNAFDPLADQTYTASNLDNDGAPSISGPGGAIAPSTSTASISIPENTTPVFTYTASKAVTWSISGTDAAKFTIAADGSLTFNPAPDFEIPGDSNTDNNYIVIVTGTDNTPIATSQTLTVTVTNVNEAPTNIALSPTSVNENVSANTPIGILSSTDPDAANSFTYTLVAGTGDTDNAAFNINSIDLRITASPDFETKPSYSVRVRTTDQGGLTFEKSFTITINNLDDTAPNLNGPGGATAPATATAAISIPENTTAVHSYTSNETVTWSISGTDVSLFTIGTDGNLVFSAAPDFENPGDSDRNNTYIVIVKAVDAVGNETTQTLTVTVTNVDDTAPNLNGPGSATAPATSTAAISVPENTTAVYSYTSNETVTWSISGTDAALFTIGTDGKLVFNAAPDFENPGDSDRNNTYILIVKARDTAGNETTQTLTVTVTNVDDTAPNLNGPGSATAPATSTAAISVPENTTAVYSYTSNETVTWSISGTDAALFTIGTDGKLVFNAAPDFENPGDSDRNNTYILIVKARDTAGNETTQTLTVTVTNVDDTAPNLNGPGSATAPATSTAAISVPENTTAVYSYTSNETVTWSISGTDAALFTIGTDGKLVFNAAPDFENPGDSDRNNTYIVIVKARDTAGNETTQTLTVTVTDVDDTAPNLNGPGGATAPATTAAAINVAENTKDVFTYTSNESVTWSISGTDAALFTIGTDGKLVFKVAPDYEMPSDSNKDNVYEITVKAVDAAGNETIQTLLVTVSDVDDTAPIISGPAGSKGATAAISVPENSLPVFSYTADESVTWSISGTDASLFTMGTDGKLVFKAAPNFELPSDNDKNNTYLLVITAKDASNNSTTQSLTVTVTNVNEAPDNLTLSISSIYENNSLNALIGNLGSSDVDAGDTFKYSIVGGDTGAFVISGNELRANTVFEFGTKSSYTIILRTTDAGGLFFNKTVNINILEAPKLLGVANLPGKKQSAASGGNVTISKGYSVNLDLKGSNLVSYNWSPSTGLNSTNISNPTANPTKTTTYTVTVTNAQGISTTLFITVTVLEDFNITPNNVISPNGDGVNDVWVIENLSAYPNNQVRIFDKAGRIIFNTKNYQNNWNGQLNGALLHDGAYYYIINLGAGSRAKVGYITLFSNQ